MENIFRQEPDLRQIVHNLAVTHRTSGLSPPEEEILFFLETEEYSEADQEDEWT